MVVVAWKPRCVRVRGLGGWGAYYTHAYDGILTCYARTHARTHTHTYAHTQTQNYCTIVKRTQATFMKHVEAKFGANKGGEVEYAGTEIAHMLIALCKGNPVSLELLFTDPARSVYEGADWTALRAIRHHFITQRCVNQYIGFVGDRLRRCRKLLDQHAADQTQSKSAAEPVVAVGHVDSDAQTDDADDAWGLPRDTERAVSKLLYHAYHKLFDLQRIIAYNDPIVRENS